MWGIGGITGAMAKSFISDDQMRTVWQQRQDRRRIGSLGETVSRLMKKTLSKRVRQLGQIAEVWDDLIPPNLRDHTALDTFVRGTLTVMVDSASHRYQLQNQIRSGLQKSIQARCSATIQRIKLVPGRFYEIDRETGERRYLFDDSEREGKR
jgi:hypothetical protein